ncbi:MAG: hypothetical protein NZ823_08150 [Blastocatellia bacterium]|nr:hypothetical protein [Blastocatellia bacterium]
MSDQLGERRKTSIGRVHRREPLQYRSEEPQSWWRASRRTFIIGTIGAAVGLGAIAWLLSDDTTDIDEDSLALQQKHGWNIGSEDKKLTLTGTQSVDSQHSSAWRKYLAPTAMLQAYQPPHPTWLPYFVPTLIQSLGQSSLSQQLSPIFTPDMKEAYERGQTLAQDFLANAQNPGETAFIVDMPGRQTLALGAGLAEHGQLVTQFDNFPHPLGVTPSHETLAAMLYYAGEIQEKQARVSATAPPVFLLDSNRLAPYSDADTQFDNRYLAKLPSAEKLRERGIKNVIYIMPDRTRSDELDDLNEDFVDYKNKGLNMMILPLSDFQPVDEVVEGASQRRYYYGGSEATHHYFFHAYPIWLPTPYYTRTYPQYTRWRTPPPTTVQPTVSPPRYAPRPRPTMFTGARVGSVATGVGRSKPSGFGRTTVRVSSSGQVVGTRAGRSGYYASGGRGFFSRLGSSRAGRSGSFGRSSSRFGG